MTYEPRTPEEIEREIEEERGQLSRTMSSLQDKMSMDGVVRDVVDTVTTQGGELANTLGRFARSNPAALALTGAGIAWMIASASRSDDGYDDDDDLVYRRRAYYRTPGRSDPYRYRTPETYEPVSGTEDELSPWDNTPGARREWTSDMHQGESRWDKAKGEYARRRASAVSSARDLRDRISDGTSHMSDDARRRVVEARTRAYEARVKAEYYARQGANRARGFYDDQPLVVGALAVAVGAALGGLLPRTEREDFYFGEQSDHLFDEAHRVYREESERFRDVARETGEDAKARARKLAGDMRDEAKDTARTFGDRLKHEGEEVMKTAETEADRQNLGASAENKVN